MFASFLYAIVKILSSHTTGLMLDDAVLDLKLRSSFLPEVNNLRG